MEENQIHIPEGWFEDRLGNLLNYEQPYKYTVNTTEYVKSGIPVLTAGKSFLLGYTAEQHNVYKDTPVIIFDDFTTDSKFVNFPFKVKSSAMKFLKPKKSDELNIKVIFGHIQNLKIRETGGDHKRRWISEFSKLKVVLPPYTEQTQIATILSKVDKAIAQTEQLIAKYTRIKTGLMQDLLTKGIDENGNIRSEATHEFKDSPLGRIPKEWECEKLSDVCLKIVDCPHSTPTYLNDGVFVARTQNIKNGKYLVELSSYVSEEEYKERILRLEPKYGDIIFTREAPIGEAFVIPKGMKICLGQRVMLFRIDKVVMLSDFLVELIYSEKTKFVFDAITGGTTVSHLNVEDVRGVLFIVPSIEEQNLILNQLSMSQTLIISFETQLTKLQSLKTGLMQDLLSGKVRVNHLIKETESV